MALLVFNPPNPNEGTRTVTDLFLMVQTLVVVIQNRQAFRLGNLGIGCFEADRITCKHLLPKRKAAADACVVHVELAKGLRSAACWTCQWGLQVLSYRRSSQTQMPWCLTRIYTERGWMQWTRRRCRDGLIDSKCKRQRPKVINLTQSSSLLMSAIVPRHLIAE